MREYAEEFSHKRHRNYILLHDSTIETIMLLWFLYKAPTLRSISLKLYYRKASLKFYFYKCSIVF